jgi:hypothetical protein
MTIMFISNAKEEMQIIITLIIIIAS